MDLHHVEKKLWRAGVRTYGGIFIDFLGFLFHFAGALGPDSFLLEFGLSVAIFGLLYSLTGIVERHKIRADLSRQRPAFHVPTTLWQEPTQGHPEAVFADPDSWHSFALGQLHQGRAEEAVVAFNRTLELEDAFPAAWFDLASAWVRLGNYGQVRGAVREELQRDPSSVAGLLLFGEGCMRTGDPDRARRAFQACLKVDHTNARARELLAELSSSENSG